MKAIQVGICILGNCLLVGCYSIEQSNIERGYRWIRRGEGEKAISTFNETVRRYPQSVLGYAGLADALFEGKRDREALGAYDRALVLLESAKPDSKKRDAAEIVGQRLLSYQNQGLSFPFGLEAYLYLRRGRTHDALARTASGLDQTSFRKAIADYDRALELSPDYAAARDARNRLLKEIKEPPVPTHGNGR